MTYFRLTEVSIAVSSLQNLISLSVTCSWINNPINQSDSTDKFTLYIKFRLATSIRCLYISVIHL